MSQDDPQPPADQAAASPLNGVIPPPEHRFRPGQSGNPKGRPTAGLTLLEWVNAIAADEELTEENLRNIGRNKKFHPLKRAAAVHLLRTMEAGDITDFSGVLKGEHNLEDLRGMGVDTAVVKKFKQKTRKVRLQHRHGPVSMSLSLFMQMHKTRQGRGAGLEIGMIFGQGLKFAEQGIVTGDAPTNEEPHEPAHDPFQ